MDKHLTENEITLYIDALVLNIQDHLPEEIRDHVAECFECKVEFLDMKKERRQRSMACLVPRRRMT